MSSQGHQELHIPRWTLADRCRRARIDAGFSQDELAEAIEVSQNTISNYETGNTTNPRRIVLTQWAWACRVPVEWLRDGSLPGGAPDGTPGEQVVTESGWMQEGSACEVVPLRAA